MFNSIYIVLSSILFIIGSFGMFSSRKHIIIILISFELMLLSIDINLVFFSIFLDDLLGQIYCLLILTVSAAESALGLAILIIYYRLRGGVSVDLISLLKS
jgi:NADH-quinone oxidoreductase subunit K